MWGDHKSAGSCERPFHGVHEFMRDQVAIVELLRWVVDVSGGKIVLPFLQMLCAATSAKGTSLNVTMAS